MGKRSSFAAELEELTSLAPLRPQRGAGPPSVPIKPDLDFADVCGPQIRPLRLMRIWGTIFSWQILFWQSWRGSRSSAGAYAAQIMEAGKLAESPADCKSGFCRADGRLPMRAPVPDGEGEYAGVVRQLASGEDSEPDLASVDLRDGCDVL